MLHYKFFKWALMGVFFLITPSFSQEFDPISVPLSPRNANYTMDVKLNPDNKIITGSTTLEWVNITEHGAPDLRFHLYYNAWRNNKSSFFKSVRYDSFNTSRYRDDEWAYSDVKSMRITYEDGREVDLTPQLTFIQPDDGNPDDRTVLQAPLAEPVESGSKVTVSIEWEAKVPRAFARTGAIGDYYFVAQWFPKIGVFEANGTWKCHQFIQTEFYADYGNYDVSMTVPTGWVVGATGQERSQQDNGDGTTTHRYYQEDVHDFVWTANPYAQVYTALFEDPSLPSVDMRLLLMPDHLHHKDRYFEATRAALKYYGTWFGAYPYGHITVVDPAYQSRSGGMEYPTMFTGGTRWLSPPEMLSPEGVTVHEAGHQFWYGIIGNDEFEDAWMDEGFNTYSTTRTMEAAYPERVLTKRYFERFIPVVFSSVKRGASRTAGADGFGGFYSNLKRDAMATQSWQQGPNAYGLNSYTKPGLMLRTLENYLGWETFQKVMSTYFDRWKFKHPRPRDFFAVVNEVSGQDMSWYFEQIYFSSNVFDYGVGSVKSKAVEKTKGYLEKEDGLVFENLSKKDTKDGDDKKQFLSTVFVNRWGEGVFPVEVQITFTDGSQATEQWLGRERWTRYDYTRSSRIERVVIDPDHKLTLDINYTNNSWIKESAAPLAAGKWAAKWMIWVQSVMEYLSFFA